MGAVITKESLIPPSRTDANGKLSYTGCLEMFMDIAAEHTEILGIGISQLAPKGMFWITAKTKAHFYRRPRITERVTLSSWPESLSSSRCIRDYRLSKGDEVLAEGRTQWAIVNVTDGSLVNTQNLYPEDLNVKDESFALSDFERIDCRFDSEPFARYTVQSTDIDLGRHMNNVAYLRALQSTFTVKEWLYADITELELQYRKPCYEGDVLEFRKMDTGDAVYIKGSIGEDTCVCMIIRYAGLSS